MNGCRFLEKSFSVSMLGKTSAICKVCGKELTDIIRKHNGDTYCQVHCPQVKIRAASLGDFHTTKDQLYHFVDVNTTGKPIEFTSKGQWKRHLKSLGMHDDIKQSPRKQSEHIKDDYKPVPKEEIKKFIMEEIKEKNLYDKFKFKKRR